MARILIIDDEEQMRTLLRAALSELYEVDSAPNGEIGIQKAISFQPDLIICDISMPHMDGFAVLNHLQTLPSLADVPFVFLSANSDEITIRAGMTLGADDFVAKPYSLQELYRVVKIRLEKRAKRQALLNNAIEELRVNITSSIPHELRTAIGIIEGYANFVLEDAEEINPVQREMMEAIHENAHRLHLMAEKYLWYLRSHVIELSEGRASNQHTDSLIHPIALNISERFDRHDDLQLNLEPIDLRIDPDYLRKIAEETIENAFKFSEARTPVKVDASLDGQNYNLRITDNGRGLTAEQISKIGAFMQFDRKLYEQKGTGLGLSIAKRLSELSGGQLTVQSTDQGTCVTVSLPC